MMSFLGKQIFLPPEQLGEPRTTGEIVSIEYVEGVEERYICRRFSDRQLFELDFEQLCCGMLPPDEDSEIDGESCGSGVSNHHRTIPRRRGRETTFVNNTSPPKSPTNRRGREFDWDETNENDSGFCSEDDESQQLLRDSRAHGVSPEVDNTPTENLLINQSACCASIGAMVCEDSNDGGDDAVMGNRGREWHNREESIEMVSAANGETTCTDIGNAGAASSDDVAEHDNVAVVDVSKRKRPAAKALNYDVVRNAAGHQCDEMPCTEQKRSRLTGPKCWKTSMGIDVV